jgi:hypothetical protein
VGVRVVGVGTLLGPEGTGCVLIRFVTGLCLVVVVSSSFCCVGGGGVVAGWGLDRSGCYLHRTASLFRRAAVGSGDGRPYLENCTVDASIFVVKLIRAHGGCLGTRSR